METTSTRRRIQRPQEISPPNLLQNHHGNMGEDFGQPVVSQCDGDPATFTHSVRRRWTVQNSPFKILLIPAFLVYAVLIALPIKVCKEHLPPFLRYLRAKIKFGLKMMARTIDQEAQRFWNYGIVPLWRTAVVPTGQTIRKAFMDLWWQVLRPVYNNTLVPSGRVIRQNLNNVGVALKNLIRAIFGYLDQAKSHFVSYIAQPLWTYFFIPVWSVLRYFIRRILFELCIFPLVRCLGSIGRSLHQLEKDCWRYFSLWIWIPITVYVRTLYEACSRYISENWQAFRFKSVCIMRHILGCFKSIFQPLGSFLVNIFKEVFTASRWLSVLLQQHVWTPFKFQVVYPFHNNMNVFVETVKPRLLEFWVDSTEGTRQFTDSVYYHWCKFIVRRTNS